MLVFTNANLVFLSVPKTGSTAYHTLLRSFADIAFCGKPEFKHLNIRQYRKVIAPFLYRNGRLQPETVAVMRDPLDHLGSWFRYRQREQGLNAVKSTAGVTFNDFLRAFMRDDEEKPAYARLGGQFKFLACKGGEVGVTHLFAHEKTELLDAFLSQRLKMECSTQAENVSPKMELEADPEVVRQLRGYLAKDFELHARVMDAGGHLVTPQKKK